MRQQFLQGSDNCVDPGQEVEDVGIDTGDTRGSAAYAPSHYADHLPLTSRSLTN